MELPPEPVKHEIGNRTYIVADVEPLDVDGVRTVQVGLGIATVLLRLDPPIRAAHAAVGYALWGAVVWTAARSGAVSLLTVPRRAAKSMPEARLA